MSTLRFTRDQLIEALEARRVWAEKYDAKNLAQHQKDERSFLADFRKACRDAAKWDYEQAKKAQWTPKFGTFEGSRWGSPSCPSSGVAALDHQLAVVRASRQQTFHVSDSGIWSRLFWVLTHDETIKAEMC